MKQILNTKNAPAAIGPYSQGTCAGNMVFVSGQLPIDPATGAPAQSDLLSVTVIAANGTLADAYSTALYVMGLDGARDFWRAHRTEFDMVLITDDTVYYTAPLEGRITTAEGGPYRVQVIAETAP